MRPTRILARLLPVLLPVLLGASRAEARLDEAQWKQAQADFARLFAAPGSEVDKAALVRLLASDQDARSWKLLLDGLVKESRLWLEAQKALHDQIVEIGPLLAKPSAQRFPEEETKLRELQDRLPTLDAAARSERAILSDLVDVLSGGPEALRKNILARGKSDPDWPVRAAAAQVAARNPEDEESQAFLERSLTQDKDPRVRSAALEALASAESGWEEHVIGRLGDPDWGVQLLAVRLAGEKKSRRAVPHLINALERASPRLQQEIGAVLQALTGATIEAYADAWARWWADHHEEFEAGTEVKAGGKPKEQYPDVKFYGLEVKSNKVLFIIDISASMKLETKNPGGEAPKPPPGPVTPGEGAGPPPPPPPEEILSGPKIDVAKDELRKAIKKLPKATRFNVFAFNHTCQVWQPQMKEASDANKEEALKWVRQLQASGSTYIDGALRQAFLLAGTGAVDKAYQEVALDTIILLSDGAPTDDAFPASNLMDPEVILQHVREWNPQRKIVIHTIAVDMVEGVEFMKKLAAQNGGTYLDR